MFRFKRFFVFSALVVCVASAKVVEIKGATESNISSEIQSQILSNIKENLLDTDADSIAIRLARDSETIKNILFSYGFFDCEVVATNTNKAVVFDIKQNTRYRFNNIVIKYDDYPEFSAGLTVRDVFNLISVQPNDYVTMSSLASAVSKIEEVYRSKGFAYVNVLPPKIIINRKKKTFRATYHVVLNPQIVIGETSISLKSQKDPKLMHSFLRNRFEWKKGDIFNKERFDETKERFIETGVFSSVDIDLDKESQTKIDPHKSESDVVVNLEEAPLRDLAAGVTFGSSERFGIGGSWTHYNVNGKGDRFKANIETGKKKTDLRATYSIFDPIFARQELSNQAFLKKENVDSYDTSILGAESLLWTEVSRRFKIGIGVGIENSTTKDKLLPKTTAGKFQKMHLNAAYIPIGVTVDSTDNFLDPQKGFRINANISPYVCSKKQNFTIASCKASMYIPLSGQKYNNKYVIACYAKFGSILSSKEEKLPRYKMFFAGGAGSVRGYGYQMLGAVNDDKRPLGGKSLFEFGIEPRVKVTETIGVVAFFEGGNVYSARTPSIKKQMLFGVGAGIRYYTPIAPIRFDIAFPLKRRRTSTGKNIDSLFNIYISVGHSF